MPPNGGMTFVRQVPDFVKKMQRGAPEEGIAGALKRHRERPEPEERSDTEEERPQVVEGSEAMTSKQRRKEEALVEKLERRGGSLTFANSAKDRFKDSAARRGQEAEAKAAEAKEEAEEPAAGVGHVFSSATGAKGKGKRKATTGAKAVKNDKLLSFDVDE
mmetsp:Transcript_23956/g.50842  ORF Transcript_23956/g.50842 Transcript_23956/m.50842 type:complete len:161 (-) Transcript_23956:178-660(-)